MKALLISIYDGGWNFDAASLNSETLTLLSLPKEQVKALRDAYKKCIIPDISLSKKAKELKYEYLIICEDGNITSINLNK